MATSLKVRYCGLMKDTAQLHTLSAPWGQSRASKGREIDPPP